MTKKQDFANIYHGNGVKSEPVLLTEADLKGLFIQHDANGDGKLDREELKKAFKKIGARLPGWRAGRAIYFADNNGDQLINVEDELDDVVKFALRKGYTIN